MARQSGLVKFTGQMGGVSFYKTAEDGYLARTKGGVDGDRIKNSPEFQRTRENGAEFGRAGAAAKLLRQAFRSAIVTSSDSRMSSRLTSEMVKVVQADTTSARGERSVIDGEAQLLEGFEFNAKANLSSTFFAFYVPVVDRAGGTVSIAINSFVPSDFIAAPSGATHFKLICASAEINFETGQFTPNIASSNDLALSNQQQAALSLETLFTPGGRDPVFVLFGIEFYQQVNGRMYSLKNGAYNALSLVLVSVPN